MSYVFPYWSFREKSEAFIEPSANTVKKAEKTISGRVGNFFIGFMTVNLFFDFDSELILYSQDWQTKWSVVKNRI